MISGFPLTNNNYLPSVELLRSRFAQPHKLVNAHMQALINLPSPSTTGDFKKFTFGSKRTIVILLVILLVITIGFLIDLVITIVIMIACVVLYVVQVLFC